MKDINTSQKYLNILKEYKELDFIDWNEFRNKTILITGVTGLVGRFLTDLIMYVNEQDKINCKIIGICRNIERAEKIFNKYNKKLFEIMAIDVSNELVCLQNIDYIIHAASNTSPKDYINRPIETIETNVKGISNLLKLGNEKNIKKLIFISSFEVYGDSSVKGRISEDDYGYIDILKLRSCYPESKRLSENLCIAYSSQYNIDVSILRLARVFGPTLNVHSTLSISQFLNNSLKKENIILKSDGKQLYSYNFVGDVVTAILKSLLNGKNKEAYNVSDSLFDATLGDFAKYAAEYNNLSVVYELPTAIEKKSYSNTNMTILNSDKLKNIGWHTISNLKNRITDTLEILEE